MVKTLAAATCSDVAHSAVFKHLAIMCVFMAGRDLLEETGAE